MLYRLYTERKNEQDVARLVAEQFKGFTMIPTMGFWNGAAEQSLIIEIDAPYLTRTRAAIRDLAERIRQLNNQECVLITETEQKSYFVSAPPNEVYSPALIGAGRA